MTRLSVNLNKVALLRNQRDIGYPSVLETAKTVLDAGAHGITIHPRPDERHIRRSDVPALSSFAADYKSPFPAFMMNSDHVRADIEFNIEGYPDDDFLTLVTTHRCDQVTLVPDAPDQKTSDHGWDVIGRKDFLVEVIKRLKGEGRRVSLFVDPAADMVRASADIGADRIELYTGPFALNPKLLPGYVEAAKIARDVGLSINAGHDLNLDNLARFIGGVPSCDEVSIGHAITADALNLGWRGAVAAYLTAIDYGHKSAKAA